MYVTLKIVDYLARLSIYQSIYLCLAALGGPLRVINILTAMAPAPLQLGDSGSQPANAFLNPAGLLIGEAQPHVPRANSRRQVMRSAHVTR